MQHFGKGALRVAKNYTKGYSDVQAKVRDATSNDPWGPSGTQMNEIAQMTYNQNDFIEVMEMLDKRLNDKGKNWRHVFKSLTVLDYCLHAGSENVVIYFRDNIYIIKTLKEFQFVDEDGKDQGANVRQKAKDITNLLLDEPRLRQERKARANMRDRLIGASSGAGDGLDDERPNENASRRSRPSRRADDSELNAAIELSKRTAAEELAKQQEENDLAQAIQLSKEEEEKRSKAVADSNSNSLFDDQPQSSNTNDLLIQVNDNNPQAFGLQPQFTQVQPQYTQLQPQFTAFNPYQQQAQQEAMQAEYLRQQQEWQLQQQQAQEEWFRQQQAAQLAQDEWTRQQQQQHLLLQQPTLISQPTGFGSNNPFAPTSSNSPVPSLSSQTPSQSRPVEFNLQGTFANQPRPTSQTDTFSSMSAPKGTSPIPVTQQFKPPNRTDQDHAHLASLIGNRDDGQDTFGNIGPLRYGQTDAGRALISQKTGASSHNPFAQQQQQQNNERPFFDI